jgi:Carboxylesterase family
LFCERLTFWTQRSHIVHVNTFSVCIRDTALFDGESGHCQFVQYGSLAGPFGPVVDGLNGILPDTPQALRDANKFLRVKIIAGVTKDEGAYYASTCSTTIR